MRHIAGLLPLVALLASIVPAAAAPLVATQTDRVVPPADFTSFIADLHARAAAVATLPSNKREAAFTALEAAMTGNLRGFRRPLDPLAAWAPIGPDEGHGLVLLASYMIEQGELGPGAPVHDYRIDMAERLAEFTAPGASFGRMPQMSKAICTPPRFGFDRKRVIAFARAHDSDVYSLRVAAPGALLHEVPNTNSPVVNRLPPRAILAFDVVDTPVDGWEKLTPAEGKTGWMAERDDTGGLSQMHLCFAKVEGSYKLTGFYAFGL